MNQTLLPLHIMTPAQINRELNIWLQQNAEFIQAMLHEKGGILFRNFELNSIAEFNQFALSLSPNLRDYCYQSTPRTRLGGKIYSSTEYPPYQVIPLHSENAYCKSWPERIMFYSMLVAKSGGQTPIADNRKVYLRIPAEVRERFESNGILYVRNYYPNIDVSWQTVFQTEDQQVIEDFCQKNNIHYEWRAKNILRTEQICQASITHPVTQQRVWFNQAHLFHISNLSSDEQALLRSNFSAADLPRHCYYGDGSPIDDESLTSIRAAYDQEKYCFNWQLGDVMVLDNLLMAHGREPFTGIRKVVVAMA